MIQMGAFLVLLLRVPVSPLVGMSTLSGNEKAVTFEAKSELWQKKCWLRCQDDRR